jgi:hypothetical protein
MAGTALSKFADFIAATGPAYLTGPEVLVNEAVERNYLWGALASGPQGINIQSGTEIRDALMLDSSNTFEFYKPNATFSYRNPNVLDTTTAPWRFAVDHMAFTDHEIELNAGEGLSRDGIKGVYKRLKRVKEQRMTTSLVNGMEKSLFANPVADATEIADAAGSQPFPLSLFINEIIVDSAETQLGEIRGGGNPLGFTDVQGIDPFTNPRWSNQVAFYDGSTNPDPGTAVSTVSRSRVGQSAAGNNHTVGARNIPFGGFLNAFDDMFLKCQYTAPAQFSEYFDNATMAQQMILTSRAGLNQYTDALRDANDRLVSPQDPAYAQPTYAGIPLRYISQLDTAKLYPGDSDASQNNSYDLNVAEGDDAELSAHGERSARYYFVNGEYLNVVLHGNHFFKKSDVMRHPNQPYTSIVLCDCWWNLMARSRQRHGIIAPAHTS